MKDKIYIVMFSEFWEFYPISYHKTLKGAQMRMEHEKVIKRNENLKEIEDIKKECESEGKVFEDEFQDYDFSTNWEWDIWERELED